MILAFLQLFFLVLLVVVLRRIDSNLNNLIFRIELIKAEWLKAELLKLKLKGESND